MVSVLGTRDGSLSSQITSSLCLVRRIATSNSWQTAIISGSRTLILFTDFPRCYTEQAKKQLRKTFGSGCSASIDSNRLSLQYTCQSPYYCLVSLGKGKKWVNSSLFR